MVDGASWTEEHMTWMLVGAAILVTGLVVWLMLKTSGERW